jgi:hypothetical protein
MLFRGDTNYVLRRAGVVFGRDLFGKSHLEKGRNSARGLEKFLRNNPDAPRADRAVAEDLLEDLQSALHE